MIRLQLLLVLLAAASLTACVTGRRSGGGGGGDDDDSASDDDDDAGPDDDDVSSDDDDTGAATTHWGTSSGSLLFDDSSQPCSGTVEMAVDGDGMSAGSVDCEASTGWRCSASWSGGYIYGKSQAEEVSVDCEGPDSGGSAEGETFLWGAEFDVNGQLSVQGSVFDYVSVTFEAQVPG